MMAEALMIVRRLNPRVSRAILKSDDVFMVLF